jgi:hypothetical protein
MRWCREDDVGNDEIGLRPDCLASRGSAARRNLLMLSLRNILIPTSARIKYLPPALKKDSSGY